MATEQEAVEAAKRAHARAIGRSERCIQLAKDVLKEATENLEKMVSWGRARKQLYDAIQLIEIAERM